MNRDGRRGRLLVLAVVGVLFIMVISACGPDTSGDGGAGEQGPAETEFIGASGEFSAEGYTLLERMYEDVDNDGTKESIEMYTSAELAPDGLMGWDDGHHWALIVRDGESIYPLVDRRLQFGDLQFWVSYINEDGQEAESRETPLVHQEIYVAELENSFRIFRCSWNEEEAAFEKTTVLNPQNQWGLRHYYQHTIPDPGRIERSMASL